MEEWKDIIGYEGLYQVSDLGNVRSLAKEWSTHNGNKRSHSDILLGQFENQKGYLRVYLYKNKLRRTFAVARLVGFYFVPNPNNLPEINHMFGNKKDNRAVVLEWTTPKGNVRHRFDVLGHKVKSGRENKNNREVRQISKRSGRVLNTFYSVTNASETLKINHANISSCLMGRRKTAGGYLWT